MMTIIILVARFSWSRNHVGTQSFMDGAGCYVGTTSLRLPSSRISEERLRFIYARKDTSRFF